MEDSEYTYEEWVSSLANRTQVPIAPGKPTEELVHYIFESHVKHVNYFDICSEVEGKFDLCDEGALLAVDYVLGGMLAAITGNSKNRPNRKYEPLALIAFELIWQELPRKRILSYKRMVTEKWLNWHQEYLQDNRGL